MFTGITRDLFLALVPQINETVYQLKLEHADTALHPFVSVSVGGTYSSAADESIEKVLLKSDNALYKAKSRGKNCFVIH